MPRGGYRPGAGRPKGTKVKSAKPLKATEQHAPPVSDSAEDRSPLDYMLSVMNDPSATAERRDRMAIAAAGYIHGRGAPGGMPKGKREMAKDAAQTAASGRYAPPAPPRLVVNNS